MCFSSPKTPSVPPPPAPAPMPMAPTDSTNANDASRRSQIERMRMGLASTIKTSPRGVSGAGADLSSSSGGKTKLGQ